MTPKKRYRVKYKKQQQAHSNFCRICGCNFSVLYGDFKRSTISTENLFAVPGRSAVTKRKLADLLCDVGFPCYENKENLSERVCAPCARKIRNAATLIDFLRTGFKKQTENMSPGPDSGRDRFKRMSK